LIMKFLSVVALVIAAACCCHGLYHVNHVINTCDYKGSMHGLVQDKYHFMNVTGHGHFMKREVYECTTFTDCSLLEMELMRPDYSERIGATIAFGWGPDSTSCETKVVPDEFYPLTVYENWFEQRKETTFHGTSCFMYFNDTIPEVAIANEAGDTLYAISIFGFELELTVIPEPHTPKDFVLDPSAKFLCEQRAYTIPSQKDFDQSCL